MSSQVNIDKLLADNGLVRKQIPEVNYSFLNQGPNSLIRAISDTIYFTTYKNEEISNKLVEYLKKLFSTNQVPHNLGILETNLALQLDYCSHPNFIGFDMINIELVSMMFQVRVNIFSVSEDGWLTAKIVNKNYNRTVEIFKNHNHYDSVYTKVQQENSFDVQEIIYEMINQAIKHTGKIPKQFKNVELDLWKEEQINKQIVQLKTNNVGGRVRSLSDQFNNDSEKVETLYNNLEEKFSKIFNQQPKPQIKGQIDMEYAQNKIQSLQNQMEALGTGGKQSVGRDNKVDRFEKFDEVNEITPLEQSHQISSIRGSPPGIYINNKPKGINMQNQSNQVETPKKIVIMDESDQRYTGRLKFFDDNKNYGFIVLDVDNTDIFVHADDLQKVGITREFLRGTTGNQYKSQTGVRHFGKGPGQAPKFSFIVMVYVGKYNKSRKAVDLKILLEV